MSTPTPPERLDRLRMARERIEAQLRDPETPPYSIAPLTNQLRLTDKEIERLTRAEPEEDDGLPTTPDKVTFLDLLQFQCRTRLHRTRSARRRDRRDEIFDEWVAAGFVPPEPAWRGDRYANPCPEQPVDLEREAERQDTRRAEADAWVEACRAELVRCLALSNSSHHHERTMDR